MIKIFWSSLSFTVWYEFSASYCLIDVMAKSNKFNRNEVTIISEQYLLMGK